MGPAVAWSTNTLPKGDGWLCANRRVYELSDQWDYDDDDNANQQQKGGGLRAQLEAALKKNKELETKLGETQTQLRKEAVSRIISSKGYKAKVAKLIPKDVDPTDEAITQWLDEYGDVLGADNLKQDSQQQQKQAPVEPDEGDDAANSEYARQMGAMGVVTGQGTQPGKDADLIKQIMDPGMDKQKLMALINAHGGGVGVG